MISCTVIVPVHNEEATLGALLQKIATAFGTSGLGPWEILVVDDGSDIAVPSFGVENVRVISSPARCGSGAARKRGSLAAAGALVAWIDGDGTYTAGDLVSLIAHIGEADQIIGARSCDYGTLSKLRYALKRVTAEACGWLWGIKIPDVNSGLRVMRREAMLQWIDQLPSGFSCTTTATLCALNHRQTVRFHPIDYLPRPPGSRSKFRRVVDSARMLRMIWRLWLRQRRCQSPPTISSIR